MGLVVSIYLFYTLFMLIVVAVFSLRGVSLSAADVWLFVLDVIVSFLFAGFGSYMSGLDRGSNVSVLAPNIGNVISASAFGVGALLTYLVSFDGGKLVEQIHFSREHWVDLLGIREAFGSMTSTGLDGASLRALSNIPQVKADLKIRASVSRGKYKSVPASDKQNVQVMHKRANESWERLCSDFELSWVAKMLIDGYWDRVICGIFIWVALFINSRLIGFYVIDLVLGGGASELWLSRYSSNLMPFLVDAGLVVALISMVLAVGMMRYRGVISNKMGYLIRQKAEDVSMQYLAVIAAKNLQK